MNSPRPPAARPPRPLAAVALLTALAFGCTTIRAPVASVTGPIPVRDGRADPQLELWLESAKPVSPEEAAAVSAGARAALEEALAGREVGDGSTVLLVREQGICRTASHRSDQTTATIGLALGAVVVVVGVILWLTSGGKGGGGKGSGGKAPAAAPPTRGFGQAGARPPPVSPALPVAQGAARPPPATLRPPPPGALPAPHPPAHLHGGGSSVGVGVQVVIPVVPSPAPGEPQVISSRLLPGSEGSPAPWPPPEGVVQAGFSGEVLLPPMAPLPLEERGFFDDDLLVLELTLVDRVTGEPRWTKWVGTDSDPCDREEVRAVLDRAFAEAEGWLPAR